MKPAKIALLILSCLTVVPAFAAPRSQGHARLLGSARLNLSAIQTLVLPLNVDEELRAAGRDLQSVFLDQLSAELQLQIGGSIQSKLAIVLILDPNGPREGAFHLKRKRTQLLIRSATQDGLNHAIYTLCHDLFNARWYWESDLGLEYISPAFKKCPEYSKVVKPAFIQRSLKPIDGDFARRNRHSGGFSFSHNLAKIFNKERFAESPEAFALIGGQRTEPQESSASDPQPNFTHPKAVEIAAEAAIAHFAENPTARSFSLSVNNNIRFDESEATQEAVAPLTYFRGAPNYTDLVFRFMNAVAERVFAEENARQTASGEDRYLTALAYFWTEAAPSFPIHPRVMPVLTSDRAQWHDPAYREQDKTLITRWAHSGAERIATWDYYFGAPYPYPRQFNQWIDASIKHLHQQGVDIFHTQLPSIWGLDGAKAWLASELLWDPSQDAAALLAEYYQNFFGAAAEPIREFYAIAEAQRNAHAGTTSWIKYHKDSSGISLFPLETLASMRAQIEKAKQLVTADPRRLARVEIASQAFSFTESYAAYHRAREALISATLTHSVDLPSRYADFIQMRSAYQTLSSQLIEEPLHQQLRAFTKIRQPDPSGMALLAMAQNQQALPEHPYQELQAFADGDRALSSELKNTDLTRAGMIRHRFPEPELPDIKDWEFSLRPSEWLQVSSATELKSGLRVSGADMLIFKQSTTVAADQTYLLEISLDYAISPDNRSYIELLWKNAVGQGIRLDIPIQLPWGRSSKIQHLKIPVQSPHNASEISIALISSRQAKDDFLDIRAIHFGRLLPLD